MRSIHSKRLSCMNVETCFCKYFLFYFMSLMYCEINEIEKKLLYCAIIIMLLTHFMLYYYYYHMVYVIILVLFILYYYVVL